MIVPRSVYWEQHKGNAVPYSCSWNSVSETGQINITIVPSPPCIPSSALLCLDRFPFAELRYAVATLFFWGIQRGSGNFFASKVTEA